MKKTEQKEDAVSPVVGVMLMLVVTIIIAAVVAAFAGGLAVSTERAPNAVLKAEIDSTWSNDYAIGTGTVFLKSLNGEDIDLKKIAVTVYNESGHSATFISPSSGLASGDTLESGETLNVAYGYAYPNYKTITGAGLTVNAGEYAQVVVIYDDSHILYDEEVVVV